MAPAVAQQRMESDIPTPEAVVGHEMGKRFTRIPMIKTWFERAAAASKERMQIRELGTTARGNPLFLAVLSSKRNLQSLKGIFASHRKLVDGSMSPAQLPQTPVIVWLSFGVHGNEPSPSEVAMTLAHEILSQPEHAKLLERLIMIFDPCLNPDGRERYVADLEARMGNKPNADPAAYEHTESWPSGRGNHYMQDLNRDWAFQTQLETQLRIRAWLEHPPQVHVDFHEMGVESEYFFFPAEVPINRHIPRQVLKWHGVFGNANAKAFDAKRWRYYSREDFDLYYPGYGDSWPSLMGAAGMTYEVGGHGAAGVALRKLDGSIWTLSDRIARHHLSGLTTLQTAASNAKEMLLSFYESHREAEAWGAQQEARYLCIPKGKSKASLDALARLLVAQGIAVSHTTAVGGILLPKRRSPKESRSLGLAAGSLVIDLAQPRARLAAALLEPDPEISHLYFYDVSAWSLPLAFGLSPSWASVVNAKCKAGWPPADWNEKTQNFADFESLAYILDAAESQLPRFADAAAMAGIEARIGVEAFRIDDKDFARGSLVLFPKKGQASSLKKLFAAFPLVTGHATKNTHSQRGPDLGSQSFEALVPVHAAMSFSKGQSATTSGAIWQLFEQKLGRMITRIDSARLNPRSLARFNMLILPGGNLPKGLASGQNLQFLLRWIEEGGVLIAIGRSASALYRDVLKGKLPEQAANASADKSKKKDSKPKWKNREERRAEARKSRAPGAILEVELDPAQILASGYGKKLAVLVRGSSPGYSPDGPGEIVAYYGKARRLSGYLPARAAKALQGTGYLLHAKRGRGSMVLFHQDPQFRLIWNGLTRLFLNAAFLLPRRKIPMK